MRLCRLASPSRLDLQVVLLEDGLQEVFPRDRRPASAEALATGAGARRVRMAGRGPGSVERPLPTLERIFWRGRLGDLADRCPERDRRVRALEPPLLPRLRLHLLT